MMIYHDGRFVADAPVLYIHDRLRLGEGVFNTMLVVDGDIKHAQRHMQKLLNASRLFWGEWNAPQADELIETAKELLRKNDFQTGRFAFNTIITGGDSGGGIRTPTKEDLKPRILMRALPLGIPAGPVSAIIAQSTRRNEHSPLSNVKYANYGDNILALREASDKGASEALMRAGNGNISCATTANLLVILDGELFTPPLSDGCQAGITRAIAIEKLGARERSITPDDLKNCAGIYLINSLRGAVPLASLDGVQLPEPTITIPQDFHIQ